MQFHLSAEEAWYNLTRATAEAKMSIDFEQYIVRDDEMGRDFLDLLGRKAREGVRVRVILDAFGSRTLRGSDAITALRQAGAQVIFYGGLRFWQVFTPWKWFPRTHVKTLHVDGRLTLLGSMGLAEYMRGWRDTQVVLTPDISKAAEADFERLWTRLTRGKPDRDLPPEALAGPRSYAVQIPEDHYGQIYESLLQAVERARHSIRIATPYFFPPKRLRNALLAAQDRGVSIHLMLSGRTDVRSADFMTKRLKFKWLKLGFEVLVYQNTTLHAKYAVIDGDWGTVGSCNFDVLSLHLNREANMVVRDPGVVAILASHFETDRQHCLLLGETVAAEAMEIA
ncbi:phosphatidylserine/phosphatidylglycerophosphate/cardiolipin synthase family protein [Asticcacaulis sp. YBE204]|uniref:phospholipase D-like domain-containing protein n=1 Tax=Asticcacaulis sp. YBE204 TaxID=1282363 RepID=UPI0003C40D80|nr:phosphatidylserine/phosphatidylglycerophosphate/cardiolipin synthase family protein [Asticcacaulis sp. YBE204]ESQ79992.1 hypothetical protein AEYBE204_09085 [Asticcacaulis sp. YBE204]